MSIVEKYAFIGYSVNIWRFNDRLPNLTAIHLGIAAGIFAPVISKSE
jgi:hypothetical protein